MDKGIIEYDACRKAIDRRVAFQTTLIGIVFTIAGGSLLYYDRIKELGVSGGWVVPVLFYLLLLVFLREDIMVFEHVKYIEKVLNTRFGREGGAVGKFGLEAFLRRERFYGTKSMIIMHGLTFVRYSLFILPYTLWCYWLGGMWWGNIVLWGFSCVVIGFIVWYIRSLAKKEYN